MRKICVIFFFLKSANGIVSWINSQTTRWTRDILIINSWKVIWKQSDKSNSDQLRYNSTNHTFVHLLSVVRSDPTRKRHTIRSCVNCYQVITQRNHEQLSIYPILYCFSRAIGEKPTPLEPVFAYDERTLTRVEPHGDIPRWVKKKRERERKKVAFPIIGTRAGRIGGARQRRGVRKCHVA